MYIDKKVAEAVTKEKRVEIKRKKTVRIKNKLGFPDGDFGVRRSKSRPRLQVWLTGRIYTNWQA